VTVRIGQTGSLAFIALAAWVIWSPALADPPCSKLAWPLEKERSILNAAAEPVASGATLGALPERAIELQLILGGKVNFPHAPQKPSDPTKFAGFVSFSAPTAGDVYISLSGEAWVDVMHDGVLVTSTAHTGDANSPGLRKSVRFTLLNKPLIVQIRNSVQSQIKLAITDTR
jgi:hypothetical protein